MATFPSSVVALPARTDGQTIFSAHMNALQDEVMAVEAALLGGALLVPQIIRDATPTLVFNCTALAKGRFFGVATQTYLSQNLSFDGTNWQADDVSLPSALLTLAGNDLVLQYAPVGANPRTGSLTEIMRWVGATGVVRERGRTTPLGEYQAVTLAGTQSAATGVWSGGSGQLYYALVGHTAFLNIYIGGSTTSLATQYVRLTLPLVFTSTTVLMAQIAYGGAWHPTLVVFGAGTGTLTIYGGTNATDAIAAGAGNVSVRVDARVQVN